MLGAGTLIIAGIGFGWMGSLAIGVIRLVQPLRGAAAAAGWAGVAATVIVMLTAFALFGVGLIVIATIQWPQRARRPAAAALATGAILLLGSLPLEGRFDGSGTPELGTPAALLFAPAVVLISLGLILLGLAQLQSERRNVTVAPAR